MMPKKVCWEFLAGVANCTRKVRFALEREGKFEREGFTTKYTKYAKRGRVNFI